MTDPELIAKKLAQIETCIEELRAMARPDRLREDIREQRFVEHTLQLDLLGFARVIRDRLPPV